MKHKLYKSICMILVIMYSLPVFALQKTLINKLDKKQIPTSLILNGNVLENYSWVDKSGKHLVFNTKSNKNNDNLDSKSLSLNVYHYILNKEKYTKVWEIKDSIIDCPLDIEFDFINDTFKITDLDKNGTFEIWAMYKKACRGDVSPIELKIIMYEGNNKNTFTGRSVIKINNMTVEGGDFNFDLNFRKNKKEFRLYALNLWNKNKYL